MIIIGMSLFTLGVDLSMLPMGESIAPAFPKVKALFNVDCFIYPWFPYHHIRTRFTGACRAALFHSHTAVNVDDSGRRACF